MKKILISLGVISIVFLVCAFTMITGKEKESGLNCYKCGGEGTIEIKVDCPVCHGDKKDKYGDNCYRCDGRGYLYETITCPECNGSGEQTKPVPFPEN